MLNTHVAIILDRSSSMETIRKETVQSFNAQVDAIRANTKGQEATVSLITFSTLVDQPTFFAAPVDSLKELKYEDYTPNGWTALNDAVMDTMNRLSALPNANDPDTAFLVIIISDGDENYSRQCTPDMVKAKLEELQATRRWTFTYVGCSEQDLLRMRNLGISAGNSRLYCATSAGVEATSALNCSATANYFAARSAGATSCDSLYDDAEKSLGIAPATGGGTLGVSPGLTNIVSGGAVPSFVLPGTLGAFSFVPFDPSKLVGMTESQADAAATAEGKYTQVAKRDGQDQILPAIADFNRVQLTIERGKVTEAQLG